MDIPVQPQNHIYWCSKHKQFINCPMFIPRIAERIKTNICHNKNCKLQYLGCRMYDHTKNAIFIEGTVDFNN